LSLHFCTTGDNVGVYSQQILDHFEHPRNSGILDNPTAAVQVENPVCGDVLKLMARVEQGKIIEIKFLVRGCVPAIACGSALTELLKGRTIDQASALMGHELTRRLGGLPEASSHAAALAIDALGRLVKGLKNSNV
jgi:nitrogen fixation protein NifU and related proteins